MEEDPELRHVCKFCSKSFPCGRSLGGHMRSHMLNNSSVKTEEKLSRGKFSSSATPPEASNQTGYGLRENPKKTCRFADSKIETSAHGKFCKECGKGFQSWKALFGHMKRHSDKDGNAPEDQNGLGEEDSWISSQSDNESENPNRRRRSGRRANTRYSAMAQTASSSLSFANNNGSSSVSEMEHEQEEVALCLMMLSRDVGHWGGLNSVAGSSDNSSVFSDDPPWPRPDRIAKIDWKKNRASGYLRNGLTDTRDFEFLENHRTDFEDSEIELGKDLIGETELDHSELFFSKCGDSGKRKFHHSYSSPEIGTDSKSDEPPEALPKYRCATCSKTFHSYQALGGHRASHKKIKGCFASRIEGSENSIEDDSKNGNSIDLLGIGVETSTTKFVLKKSEGHECPICFRVFLSGQALGGHKRSHLIGGSQARNDQAAVLNDQRPTPEIRDLLDLNLPAPVEDEGNANGIGFKPWWVGNNHKHEPPVDLISN